MPNAEVFILGKKYTIKGDATREQILHLGKFIDEKIKDVCAKVPGISPDNAIVLTLFDFAEELQMLKAEQDILSKQIKEKTELLTDLFE